MTGPSRGYLSMDGCCRDLVGLEVLSILACGTEGRMGGYKDGLRGKGSIGGTKKSGIGRIARKGHCYTFSPRVFHLRVKMGCVKKGGHRVPMGYWGVSGERKAAFGFWTGEVSGAMC